jgi:hypothetical protein
METNPSSISYKVDEGEVKEGDFILISNYGRPYCRNPFPDEVGRPVKDYFLVLRASNDRWPFQERVKIWTHECFGSEVATNKEERNFRFLEEALELVQACGTVKEDAMKLVEYVYSRPAGNRNQEVGGTMVTLAALCNAHEINMTIAAETELARCWLNVARIRAKHASKTVRTPLPGAYPSDWLKVGEYRDAGLPPPVTYVSDRDWNMLMDMIENPREPSQKLVELIRQAKVNYAKHNSCQYEYQQQSPRQRTYRSRHR